MIEWTLICHQKTPPDQVNSIDVSTWRDSDRVHFRYLVEGAQRLILPDPAVPGRADDLWKTTCFEAFVGNESSSYIELNFSPSGQWAAYRFDSHREGMRQANAEVEVWLEGGEDWIAVEAAVAGVGLLPESALGLTAVIDEKGGRQSYWAFAHPDGPPDFHDRSCFLARLPE